MINEIMKEKIKGMVEKYYNGIMKRDREAPLLHITHNDADALGCAWIIDSCNALIGAVPSFNAIGKINEDSIIEYIDEGKYTGIIISDISPSEDFCKKLEERYESGKLDILLGFDHHKSFHLDEKFEWFIKVIEYEGRLVSAAEIVYTAFKDYLDIDRFPDLFRNLVMSVSRYDTWNWVERKDDKSQYIIDKNGDMIEENEFIRDNEDFVSVISKFYGVYPLFKKYRMYYDSMEFVNENRDLYKTLKENENRSVETYIKFAKFMYLDGYRVAIFISSDLFSNAAASKINEEYDVDMVIYMITHISQIALRSNKIDVSTYAIEKYGAENAGGHASAAGARLSPEEFCQLLLRVYNTKEKLINQ